MGLNAQDQEWPFQGQVELEQLGRPVVHILLVELDYSYLITAEKND